MSLSKLNPLSGALALILIGTLAGCDSGSGSSSSSSKACAATGAFSVGDVGPSGGLIFYVDDADAHSGFTYLEAAPEDLLAGDGIYSWAGIYDGAAYFIGASGAGVGTGSTNTTRIVNYLNQAEQSGRAAQRVADYEVNGCDDWFLPSKAELNWMFVNLHQEGLGDFQSGYYYWSSTEAGPQKASGQSFSSGSQTDWLKTLRYRVRPVRAF